MAVKLPIRESRVDAAAASVEELIFQLRAEGEDYPDPSFERDQLARFIATATEWVESYTGCVLIDSVYSVYLDSFTANCIELPLYPVLEVQALAYRDTAGDMQTLATSAYSVDLYSLRPRVAAVSGWPSLGTGFNGVKITVRAGFDDVAKIPPALKAAILMLAAHLEQNALAAVPVKMEEIPFGVRSLADHHKVSWL